ncbi:3'(2'),5'-bisphosphate nucleotidase [Exophiala oligosperma]|uniref:3'(2'),5'-bisphosphate nucleotidase n=1 Tax=Exophiala oligosperma TaxID=215243 RepID=A0A0D2DHV8_9EURO|nr:3'(2'),5'-bisphosphate nucleotidase [Exophiala oligosperma]KIW42568.1 3'(2'),5'-bisphosphate nucleotidase [Exophiala oligosperma]
MTTPYPYQKELEVGLSAVRRAALLTKTVLSSVDKGAQTKDDNSPVTIADLGAQALLISAIHHNFPDDQFVGEESSETLRKDQGLCDRVWDLVRTTGQECHDFQHILCTVASREDMLEAIDRGGGGRGGNSGRIWMLDPIDGTKAFMTGGQYVVALALVEDGEQRVAVLGCPNLSLERFGERVSDETADPGGDGVVVSAVRGQGAYMRPLSSVLSPQSDSEVLRRISKPPRRSGQPVQFVESTQSRSSDLDAHRDVATILGSKWPGTEVFAIQMRYIAVAAGHCDVMVRIPSDDTHREMAWDHAGGVLVLQEAGGKVEDLDGNPIDFGAGRKLQSNHGIVAALNDVHPRALETAQRVVRDRSKPS